MLELDAAEVAAAMAELQGPPLEVDDLGALMSSYLSAITADQRGEHDVASEFYRQILDQDPIHLGARERAFSLFLSQGNIEGALSLMKGRDDVDDVSGQPMYLLTDFYYQASKGNMTAAYKALDEAEEKSPQMMLLQLARAYMDVHNGKPVEDALAAMSVQEAPPYLVAFKYYHMGRLYESVGQTDKALEAYTSGSLVDGSSLFIAMALGALHERAGHVDKALKVYDNFLRLNPDSAWLESTYQRINQGKAPPPAETSLGAGLASLVFDFGTIMVSQQVFVTAKQFFQLALLVDPNHTFAQFYVGLLNEQSGNMDQAIVYYQGIPEGAAAYLSAQIRIAESIYADGNKKGALNLLTQLLKKHPKVDILRRWAAQMDFDMGNFAEAIEQYDAILADVTTPERKHAMLFFSRGASHERLQQFDAASKDLEQALAFLPDNPMVLNYLGYMWADMDKNIEQAYAYIRRAIELRPEDGAIVDSLGWAYYKKGDYEKAVKYLEQATSLVPEDATVNAHLGDVYEKLGRMDEAYTQWQRALELGPDREDERKALEKKLSKQPKR